jgi:hypothetical protein
MRPVAHFLSKRVSLDDQDGPGRSDRDTDQCCAVGDWPGGDLQGCISRERQKATHSGLSEMSRSQGEFVVSGGSASGAPDIKHLNRSKVFIRRTDTDFSFLGEAKQTYT